MNIQRIETKEEISSKYNINDGSTVIVIDTCMFSSSLITLFECGVENVNVFKEWKDTDYPFGGEGKGKFDFGNYPQSIYGFRNNLGSKVGFTSDNGAIACYKVREISEKCELLIGSCLNMEYLVDKVKNNFPDNIIIIQAGSHNSFQLEDSITSGLISQYFRNIDIDKIELFEKHLSEFVKEYYPWIPNEDIQRLSNFNNYNILPVEKEYSEKSLSFKDL